MVVVRTVGLRVREEDVAASQRILEDSLQDDALHIPIDDVTEEGIEVFAWPQCRNCGERRLAVCPICETSGVDFPIADNNFSAGEATASFACICTICDEPWSPEFPPQCEWCNYDFASGEINEPEPVPVPSESVMTDLEPIEINQRALIAILGMVALLGGLALWFMAITPQ